MDTPRISTQQMCAIPGIYIEEVAGLSVSGATHRIGDSWGILINTDDAPVRRRFTIAHEIKHILDDQAVNHLRKAGGALTTPDWLTERICDYFAACLLMPRAWINRIWATTQDAGILARTFEVSHDALRIRLQNIGLTHTPRRCDGARTRDVIPLSTQTATQEAM